MPGKQKIYICLRIEFYAIFLAVVVSTFLCYLWRESIWVYAHGLSGVQSDDTSYLCLSLEAEVLFLSLIPYLTLFSTQYSMVGIFLGLSPLLA